MKVLYVLIFVIGVTYGAIILKENAAYGYITKIGMPEALRIRKAEQKAISHFIDYTRIYGGIPASSGEFPWQVILLFITEIRKKQRRPVK